MLFSTAHTPVLLDFFVHTWKIGTVSKQTTANTMPERRKLETILTENKLISGEQLKQVASYAQAVGIDLHEAVLLKKIASPDAVMMAYAESVGFPFIHLADVLVDESVALQIDPMTARQYSFVPISIDHGHVLLATTKPIIPDVAEELRMTYNLPVRCVICAPAELSAAIAKHYPRGAVRVSKAGQETVPVPKTKKPESIEPMNDADRKNRLWMSVVACNFSFAFVFFAMNYLQIPRGLYNTWYHPPVLALVSLTVGGLVALVTWRKLSW